MTLYFATFSISVWKEVVGGEGDECDYDICKLLTFIVVSISQSDARRFTIVMHLLDWDRPENPNRRLRQRIYLPNPKRQIFDPCTPYSFRFSRQLFYPHFYITQRRSSTRQRYSFSIEALTCIQQHGPTDGKERSL